MDGQVSWPQLIFLVTILVSGIVFAIGTVLWIVGLIANLRTTFYKTLDGVEKKYDTKIEALEKQHDIAMSLFGKQVNDLNLLIVGHYASKPEMKEIKDEILTEVRSTSDKLEAAINTLHNRLSETPRVP